MANVLSNGRRTPDSWRERVTGQLEADERLLAWFVADLDPRLNFAESAVVLTDRRLFSLEESEGGAAGRGRSWPLDQLAHMYARDRWGLGLLELDGEAGQLATWHYTASRAKAAQKFSQRFEALTRADQSFEEDAWDMGDPTPDDASPLLPTAHTLIKLLKFARPRSKLITWGFVLTMLATAASLVPPYLTGPLTDLLATGKTSDSAEDNTATMNLVYWYLAGIGVMAVVTWLLAWAQGIVMALASERISADLRNRTYAHLQQLSLEYFGGKRTGDLLTRISTDTDRICTFLSDNLVDFVSDVLLIIGTAAVLFYINGLLALAAMLPLPFIIFLVYKARNRMSHGFTRGGRAWGEMTSILADTIPGIRVVKAFAQEQREIDRFERANQQIIEANDRVNIVWTFFWPMVAMLNQFGMLFVWGMAAWLVFRSDVALASGALMQAMIYIGRVYIRLESMSRMLSVTQRAAAAQRVFEILDRVPSVPEPAHPIHPGRLRGEIELRNVSFRHGSRLVIQNVNLTIHPKEMIGLVGPSGSGKSTLVNLVCRFYDVAEGAILVDGVDIRNFPVAEYRRDIGMVLQDPFLFYGTVSENIAYGRPDASREEIIAAAKAARAHEFILRLPLGYDSLVGERGQTLSGGERQRISIARAILIDPQILILDEATSSVDTETEREIQLALDYLVEGRTTIAIAHRLSTLRKADRLVVLDRGRIVEIGQHQDLILSSGVYARLHKAQEQLVASGQEAE